MTPEEYSLMLKDHHEQISKMNDLGKCVLAHRFMYYVMGYPVISDREYDKLEDRAIEDPANKYLEDYVGNDCVDYYPHEIKYWCKTDFFGNPKTIK